MPTTDCSAVRRVVCVTALFAGISCRFNLHTSYLPGNEIQFDLRCSLTELKSWGVKVGVEERKSDTM